MLFGKCFTGENMLVDIDNATSRHFRGCFPLLSGGQRLHYIGANSNSAFSIHFIGANSDSAVSTQVKGKSKVKVKREAKVQRTGMTTRHNGKIKHDSKHADSDSEADSHSDASSTKWKLQRMLARKKADDSDADSHSDASSTKLKLRRILAKTAERKECNKQVLGTHEGCVLFRNEVFFQNESQEEEYHHKEGRR